MNNNVMYLLSTYMKGVSKMYKLRTNLADVVYSSSSVDYDEIVPGAVVTYDANNREFMGLIKSVVGVTAIVYALTSEAKYCANADTFVCNYDGIEYHANLFRSTAHTYFNKIKKIIKLVSPQIYYAVLSADLMVSMSGYGRKFWHIDNDGNYIIDNAYLKNPVPVFLFGLGTLSDITPKKEPVEPVKQDVKPKEQPKPQTGTKNKKKTKVTQSPAERHLNEIPNRDFKADSTKEIKDRVDYIFDFYSDVLIDGRLPVKYAYNENFFNKHIRLRSDAIVLSKDEFIIVMNSTIYMIAKMLHITHQTSATFKRMCTCLYAGRLLGRRNNHTNSIAETIQKEWQEYENANGKTISDFTKLMIDKFNLEGGFTYNYHRIMKILKPDTKHDSNAPIISIRESIDKEFEKHYFLCLDSNKQADIRLLLQDITDEDAYKYGSEVLSIKSDDMVVRFFANLVLFKSIYKTKNCLRFLSFDANIDMVAWLNSMSINGIYDSSKNDILSITPLINAKVVAHYICASGEEITSLATASDDQLPDKLYTLMCTYGKSAQLIYRDVIDKVSSITTVPKNRLISAVERNYQTKQDIISTI